MFGKKLKLGNILFLKESAQSETQANLPQEDEFEPIGYSNSEYPKSGTKDTWS